MDKPENALAHAEIQAIDQACRKLGGWRLWNCEIYVTLEPCPMCAGAIINAHIPKVFFGAYDFTVNPIAQWQTMLPIPQSVKNVNSEVAQNPGY